MDNDLLDQLRKTDPRTLLFGSIAFLALIGPAALEIYMADAGAFERLSISKIVLLSLGATLPVGVLNTLFSFEAAKHIKVAPVAPGTPHLDITAGLFITALLLYIDLFFQFVFQYSLKSFIVVGIFLEFVVVVWSIVQIRGAKKSVTAAREVK